jgi:hypothetical protein
MSPGAGLTGIAAYGWEGADADFAGVGAGFVVSGYGGCDAYNCNGWGTVAAFEVMEGGAFEG